MPTFGSLFAGIGGIDLGLERAGWTCRWQVEWDPFCQRVLAKHWPDVTRYGDITTVDWSDVERVDLIAGGFPCQPVSVAGKRLAQADERWLWPEFARAVRDLRPRLVLVENVPGLLARGMGDVLGDLAALGYDTEWSSLSAAAVGAPHLRERIFVVASDTERDQLRDEHRRSGGAGGQGPAVAGNDGAEEPLAHANGPGREERCGAVAVAPELGPAERCGQEMADATGLGQREPTDEADPFAGSRDSRTLAGSGGWWLTEPDVGRVAHGVPSRVDRLRSLGNAVVPQVAEVIGRRLRVKP